MRRALGTVLIALGLLALADAALTLAWQEPISALRESRAQHRLAVETDGFGVHGKRRAFEEDRDREQRLAVAGWQVVRFTWRQVTRNRGHVIRTLQALLQHRPRS